MEEELIDLYRAVRERRGEWQYGDRALWQGREVFINAIFDDGDVEISAGYDESGQFCQIADVSADDPDLLYLPPVYSEDGRCLWAWVDWERWDLWVHEGGVCSMFRKDEWGEWDVSDYDYKNPVVQEATLPEALLRAIAEQEADHE